ncbi:MAG: PhoH family protein [Rhodobacterales bacterium]|nr:PhoH family protein [Pseudomonadota bacterium]MDA1286181.1 PhoH family protein [Pseudomonadota bacterium]NQW15193.1 PhoH family protein [Rhodobacter sp.]HBN32262.1 phosphate starvation-inducible protein PhoH [Paracoccaceae bacterium]
MATSALTPPPVSEDVPQTLLDFPDNRLLIDLCGEFDCNLAHIEQTLEVQIMRRGNHLIVLGDSAAQKRACETLQALYARLETGRTVEFGDIKAALHFGGAENGNGALKDDQLEMFRGSKVEIKTRKKSVNPRTTVQTEYVNKLFAHELVFGLGPAGTGKTYLAVAVAVSMFIEGHVDKIILSRPAVEAGERLGFLPGDMKDKVDPYMQPLYDALNDFLPGKQLAKLLEEKRIEIAPLAFMRGRTLSNAFVVLDEAQNATSMQMRMFLTRLGEGSRMAITGDMTQVDLPRGVLSGLIEAERVLRNVEGIGFARFTVKDVVRHPMVAKIITAYDKATKPDA